MLRTWDRALQGYAIALGATLFIAGARVLVSDTLGNFTPLIPFMTSVVLAAWRGGLRPGLFATVLSVAAADYLYVPNQHSLVIRSTAGAVALGVFATTGLLISLVCESLHRARRGLEAERERLAQSIERERCAQEALRTSDQRKNEFLATLAHELRNPLTPIQNAAAILRETEPGSPQSHWARDVILRQVKHMTRLIEDLMDVARITRGKLELRLAHVDMHDVVRSALETSHPRIEAARHELKVSLPEQPAYVEADKVRLAQVISNLLNNASKYTPPGGRIELVASQDADTVLVSVRDSGVGIPPSMLRHIFEPFTQLEPSSHRSEGGLGIGLALSAHLVQMHGGEIEAQSEGAGSGSRFTVRLPAARRQPAPLPG